MQLAPRSPPEAAPVRKHLSLPLSNNATLCRCHHTPSAALALGFSSCHFPSSLLRASGCPVVAPSCCCSCKRGRFVPCLALFPIAPPSYLYYFPSISFVENSSISSAWLGAPRSTTFMCRSVGTEAPVHREDCLVLMTDVDRGWPLQGGRQCSGQKLARVLGQ